MNQHHTYRVVVTREYNAWLADVPELDGAHTYARNLPGLDQAVRETIAMLEDMPDGAEPGIRLAYEYRTGDPHLDEAAAQVRAARSRVAVEKQQVERQTVELARQMLSRHSLSVRDAATLLDVTPQRISQVAPSERRARKAGRAAVTGRNTADGAQVKGVA
ncbi:hypothetical protein GCM10011608_10950 [Micromonospora sonchi]|uniref:Type II toxin-antitoxin system HicB family antitoxin n=1 Tax=Micromonospora sonchi TaxID=1763543 RepID=A0A917TMF3_9ACTN|nr:type II toxin-antitoxin system HicB family antitoxin [Micromonospora sonchi]GGM27925.1 hypothetical protein GCM10011608_10950 [Micromonospora sonchi]